MSRRDFLRFFFKWKSTIIGTFLFIVIMVTLLAYVLPPTYIGRSVVLIERNKAPIMRSDMAMGQDLAEVVNTEMELVLSYSVMKEVVEKLKPHEQPRRDSTVKRILRSIKQFMVDIGLKNVRTPAEGWIAELLEEVDVKPVVNSNILNITYSNEAPKWAADIVNAVTDAYINLHLKTYSSHGASEFFKHQMALASDRLSVLRQEIQDYKRKFRIIALDESERVMTAEISALRTQLGNDRSDLTELLDKFEPSHNKVLLKKKKIQGMEHNTDKIRAQIQTLEQHKSNISKMQMLINPEEKLFLDYKQRYSNAMLGEESTAALINIRVVEYSAIPEVPWKSRLFFIMLAMGIGLVISVGIAFLREYFDHRVSDPAIIEDILGIPQAGSVEWFK